MQLRPYNYFGLQVPPGSHQATVNRFPARQTALFGWFAATPHCLLVFPTVVFKRSGHGARRIRIARDGQPSYRAGFQRRGIRRKPVVQPKVFSPTPGTFSRSRRDANVPRPSCNLTMAAAVGVSRPETYRRSFGRGEIAVDPHAVDKAFDDLLLELPTMATG